MTYEREIYEEEKWRYCQTLLDVPVFPMDKALGRSERNLISLMKGKELYACVCICVHVCAGQEATTNTYAPGISRFNVQ